MQSCKSLESCAQAILLVFLKLFFMLKRRGLGTLVREGWRVWRDWPSRVRFALALGTDFTEEGRIVNSYSFPLSQLSICELNGLVTRDTDDIKIVCRSSLGREFDPSPGSRATFSLRARCQDAGLLADQPSDLPRVLLLAFMVSFFGLILASPLLC